MGASTTYSTVLRPHKTHKVPSVPVDVSASSTSKPCRSIRLLRRVPCVCMRAPFSVHAESQYHSGNRRDLCAVVKSSRCDASRHRPTTANIQSIKPSPSADADLPVTIRHIIAIRPIALRCSLYADTHTHTYSHKYALTNLPPKVPIFVASEYISTSLQTDSIASVLAHCVAHVLQSPSPAAAASECQRSVSSTECKQ